MTVLINSMDDDFTQPKMQGEKLEAGLYLVSTPIGNLRDITLRGLETLKNADLIVCEDTRMTGKLLSAYGIQAKLAVYNDHSQADVRGMILGRIMEGGAVALVSDAGTPLVSDPGYKLVQACIEQDLRVIPVPGANAVLPALQLSGLPSDAFYFGGFLPRTSSARVSVFAALKTLPASLMFYESPNRLDETVADAYSALGDRPVALVREITKMFEICVRGTLETWAHDPSLMGILKGECVLLIGGAVDEALSDDDISAMLRKALQTQSLKDAAAYVAQATGHAKKHVYDMALKIRDES